MRQVIGYRDRMRLSTNEARRHFSSVIFVLTVAAVGGCAGRIQPAPSPVPVSSAPLPDAPFTHPPSKPHDPTAPTFTFDQLEHYYRVPGEFTHRLTGDEYGFEKLSFIITETHAGGGPGLHVHDVEEAHILLKGTALYRLGAETFTVQAPYIARVPPGVPHTFVNAGKEPFNLIAVFASNHPTTTRVGPNPLVSPPK